jgi:hypothetical protein
MRAIVAIQAQPPNNRIQPTTQSAAALWVVG